MDDIPWYGEATLAADTRVFCAGTLAQCVRRWLRLSEEDKALATIKLGPDRQTLSQDQIVALSKKPDLYKI